MANSRGRVGTPATGASTSRGRPFLQPSWGTSRAEAEQRPDQQKKKKKSGASTAAADRTPRGSEREREREREGEREIFFLDLDVRLSAPNVLRGVWRTFRTSNRA